MSTLRRTCWTCGERFTVRLDTDRHGRLVEHPDPCACVRGAAAAAPPARPLQDDETEADRRDLARRTGECMDCGRPVEGTVGKAIRCAAHKQEARRRQGRAAEERTRDRRRAYNSERWHSDPEFRARKLARKRELHAERMANDPEYRERYRQRRQRERLFSYPHRAKQLETERRHNADPERQERKREWARRRYYELHPERPKPICATCSEAIPYDGRGAPPKYHQTAECNPWLRRAAGRAA